MGVAYLLLKGRVCILCSGCGLPAVEKQGMYIM